MCSDYGSLQEIRSDEHPYNYDNPEKSGRNANWLLIIHQSQQMNKTLQIFTSFSYLSIHVTSTPGFLTFKMSRDKLYVCVCVHACVRVWPRGCRRRWFWAGCDWTVCPRPPTLRWVCVETRSCGCSWGSDSSEIYDCSPIWESQSDRPPRSPPPRTPPASELTHRALTSLQSPSHRVC